MVIMVIMLILSLLLLMLMIILYAIDSCNIIINHLIIDFRSNKNSNNLTYLSNLLIIDFRRNKNSNNHILQNILKKNISKIITKKYF